MKYSKSVFNFFNNLRMNAGIQRMLSVAATVFLMVHLMSCLWFLAAKMEDFGPGTWVARLGLIEASQAY